MSDLPEPERGHWYKAINGVHRGKEGVCDGIRQYPAGVFYRLTHPHLKEPIGWFRAEQLAEINPPAYVSKLPEEVQAEALRLVTTGRRDA